jgi:hypothetical protein
MACLQSRRDFSTNLQTTSRIIDLVHMTTFALNGKCRSPRAAIARRQKQISCGRTGLRFCINSHYDEFVFPYLIDRKLGGTQHANRFALFNCSAQARGRSKLTATRHCFREISFLTQPIASTPLRPSLLWAFGLIPVLNGQTNYGNHPRGRLARTVLQ